MAKKTFIPSKLSSIGLVGIIGILVLGILSYVLSTLLSISTYSSLEQTQTRITQNPSATATPSEHSIYLPIINDKGVPADEWIIRDEGKMGIKFQYPKLWYTHVEPGILSKRGALTITSYDPSNRAPESVLTDQDVKVTLVWENYGQPDSQGKLLTSESIRNRLSGEMDIIDTAEKFINGTTVVMVSTKDTSSTDFGRTVRTYYISVNDKIFTVSAEPADTNFLPAVEKLISTLEFVD